MKAVFIMSPDRIFQTLRRQNPGKNNTAQNEKVREKSRTFALCCGIFNYSFLTRSEGVLLLMRFASSDMKEFMSLNSRYTEAKRT